MGGCDVILLLKWFSLFCVNISIFLESLHCKKIITPYGVKRDRSVKRVKSYSKRSKNLLSKFQRLIFKSKETC